MNVAINNVAVETANLPFSAVTRLGCLLIATGLANLASGESVKISQSFVKQLREVQQLANLRGYGIKPEWLSENPKIITSFASNIRSAIGSKVANDPTVSNEELKFAKFAVLFAADPEKNANYIDRAQKIAASISPSFLRNFEKVLQRISDSGGINKTEKKSGLKDLYTERDEIAEQLLGRKIKAGEKVPADQLKKLMLESTDTADLVKQYKVLGRQISANYDSDFASYMSSQDKLVDVDTAYKYMKSLGYRDFKVLITDKKVPLKVGLSNGKIKYFTESGKPLQTGIPANATELVFSRVYDDAVGTGAYLSYTTPEALGRTRVYTEEHQKQAVESKFSKADAVDASIDKVLTRWKADLSNPDILVQMAASVCVMIYLTGMRVGARQNTAASASGEKTFGAISLRPRHIKVSTSSIILKYSGKKAVEQKHIIKLDDAISKKLAKNLESYLVGKKGDDLVFEYVNGRGTEKTLSYGILNKYLATSGYPAGLHKMRHVRGTNMVIDLLNKTTWKPSVKAATNLTKRQKEAEDFIVNKIITPATNLLGHKSGTGASLWRTTIKSYINPAVLISWFDKHNLRRPNWLPLKATDD